MKKLLIICLLIGGLFGARGAVAGDLVWSPINPSFGGSSLNGQWLLSSAQIQDPHGFLQTKRESTIRDPLERFEERLTDRIFYQLSQEIVEAAFGEGGLPDDTIYIGDYTIIVGESAEGGIKTTITDTTTGNSTTVEVPYY